MRKQLKPEFVDAIPEVLDPDTLYLSMRFRTTVHECACGCGEKVVAKLSPNDWNMTYNGRDVTLSPSIGNWTFPCRSHYFIRGNNIVVAGNMSSEAIEKGRTQNAIRKVAAMAKVDAQETELGSPASKETPDRPKTQMKSISIAGRFWNWLGDMLKGH